MKDIRDMLISFFIVISYIYSSCWLLENDYIIAFCILVFGIPAFVCGIFLFTTTWNHYRYYKNYTTKENN